MMTLSAACRDDLGFDPTALTPAGLLAALDRQVADMMAAIERSTLWTTLTDPATPDDLVRETLKEIYLEIAMYQPTAIEGAVRAIAQFPRRMPVAWWDEMLQHQVEEFDHGEMALRDYHAFGGDAAAARARLRAQLRHRTQQDLRRHPGERHDAIRFAGGLQGSGPASVCS